MTPNPTQIEAIFSGALERSTVEDRAAFLEESCAGDTLLRERVEALLRAHQDARHFLQSLLLTSKTSMGDMRGVGACETLL